jgi:four helix bundle protein
VKGTITRFEDFVAWQKARVLSRRIYEICGQGELKQDWGLASQLRRSAVSIMANIAEGHERSSPGEFHRFLSIAKGSCAEVRSHLYIAKDVDYIGQEDFEELMDLATEVGRIVGGLRASIARKKDLT